MGSAGNSNSWPPYDNYKDCSQVICSIYCPQWCYIIFPPPPPLGPPDDGSGTTLSPIIIAVIGILASAFVLVSYYTIISKYCRRRGDRTPSAELEANRDQMTQDLWQVASTGLDEALIKSITVCKYKKGDGLVEGTECAVCLNEFHEDESLRLLPKCNHAFHLPCIDTWLKSHSNCPLCRASLTPSNPMPAPSAPSSQNSSTLGISSLEIQRHNDLILVVDDGERGHREEVVVSLVSDITPKDSFRAFGNTENSEIGDDINLEVGQEGLQQFRRSISLGSFSCQRRLLIADILRPNEDDDKLQVKNCEFPMGTGSSKCPLGENSKSDNRSRDLGLISGPAAMRRSISMGRFMFTGPDKGKNSIVPNRK